MYTVVVLFHILACVALILIVLLQTGRGAEMGAAFGGASQTLFGGSGGTTFLSKLTTAAAVVFMFTCLGLTYLSMGPQNKSIMENVPVQKQEAPALPEAKPVQPMPAQPGAPESSAKPDTSAPAPQSSAAQPQPSAGAASQPGTAGQAPAAGNAPAPTAGQ